MTTLPSTGPVPLPGLLPNLDRPSWTVRLADWVVASRSHRVICILIGIWMLNAFDLALTMMSHYYGFLDEANPVARHFLNGGTAPIVLFKASMVMIGSAPLIHFRRTRLVEMASFVILITYALLAVRWTVCFELYAASANCPSLRYLAY